MPGLLESEKGNRNVVHPLVGAPQRFLWVRMVHMGSGDLCAVGEASGTPWVGIRLCFGRFQASSGSLEKGDNGDLEGLCAPVSGRGRRV